MKSDIHSVFEDHKSMMNQSLLEKMPASESGHPISLQIDKCGIKAQVVQLLNKVVILWVV